MKCDKCELCHVARSVRLDSLGDINSPIFIMGARPTLEDEKLGKSFSAKTGAFVFSLLKSAGISTDNCYFTYAVKCFVGLRAKGTQEQLVTCAETWAINELKIAKPKLVISFGAEAYRAATALTSRKSKDTLHEVTVDDHTFYILALPAIYSLQQLSSHVLANTATAIRKAVSVIDGSGGAYTPDKLKELNYQTIRCIGDFDNMMDRINATKEVAVDIESRKNNPYQLRDEKDKGCPLETISGLHPHSPGDGTNGRPGQGSHRSDPQYTPPHQ